MTIRSVLVTALAATAPLAAVACQPLPVPVPAPPPTTSPPTTAPPTTPVAVCLAPASPTGDPAFISADPQGDLRLGVLENTPKNATIHSSRDGSCSGAVRSRLTVVRAVQEVDAHRRCAVVTGGVGDRGIPLTGDWPEADPDLWMCFNV